MKRDDLIQRLEKCAATGEFACHDDPPGDWTDLMREAIAALREPTITKSQASQIYLAGYDDGYGGETLDGFESAWQTFALEHPPAPTPDPSKPIP